MDGLSFCNRTKRMETLMTPHPRYEIQKNKIEAN